MSTTFVERKVFRAGDVIFREGSIGDCAYLIEKGEVSVIKGPPNAEVELDVLSSGATLGEVAMLEARPRAATAIAKTETVVTFVSRIMFEKKLSQADPFIKAVLRTLAKSIPSSR